MGEIAGIGEGVWRKMRSIEKSGEWGMRKKRKRNRRKVGEGKGKKASEEGGRKRKCIIGRSREKERIKNKIKDTKHIKRTEKEKRRDR